MKKYSLANLCLYANEVAPAKSDLAFTAIARHILAYSVFALPRDGAFHNPFQ
ncbi:MAG TPA: hypothetical protein VL095_16420 [Flavisolibacter sp.]|nr:hypothetical protein [Flavisolibacter sp.]